MSLPLTFPCNLRPLDNSRDLLAVADLIDICFSEHMDADGREYLNHIRRAAQDSQYLRWIPGSGEMASYPLHGYVWEQEGKVVGNLTLIPCFVRDHWRYLIVNVAVHPQYRRLGIGRQLTLKGLEHIQKHGANAAWLQVRNDNPGALQLYRSLGFTERSCRNTWITDSLLDNKVLPPEIQVLPRNDSEWPLHYQWLNQCYPPEVSWHLPISIRKIRPSLLSKVENILTEAGPRHFTCYESGKPIGFASLDNARQTTNTVWLAVGETQADLAIRSLLTYLRTITPAFHTLTLNFPEGVGEKAFKSTGFSLQNTLIWMEVPFRSGPLSLVQRIFDRISTL